MADGANFYSGVGQNSLTPRHELVIGVNDYTYLNPLKNPRNDATKVYASLKKMGFEGAAPLVDVETDGGSDTRLTTRNSIYQALGDLSRAAKNDGGVLLIYFAGHGLTYQDQTYLLPSDAPITDPSDVKTFGIPMSDIFDKVKAANATAAVIIIDACRNNPFGQQPIPSDLSLTPFLRDDPPPKTLAMFSTIKGNETDDGSDQDDSPFTTSLLAFLEDPDRSIEEVLSSVRSTYLDAEKVPILNSRITGELPLMSTENEFKKQAIKWAQASQINTSMEFDGFIRSFPGGYFERAARQKLNQTAQNEAIAAVHRATSAVLASNRIASRGAILYSNPFIKTGRPTPLTAGEPLSVVGKSGNYLLVVRDRNGMNGYVLERLTQAAPSTNITVAFDSDTGKTVGDTRSAVQSFVIARQTSIGSNSVITVQTVLPITASGSEAVQAHEGASIVAQQLVDAGVPKRKVQIAPTFRAGATASIQIIGAADR